jgi:hypothetical protein
LHVEIELTHAVIRDFFFRTWSVAFRVVFDPVKDLVFTILIKIGMLPSMFQWIHPMLRCRFHTSSQAFECPRQHVDRSWNVVLPLREIANIRDRLASEFDFLKNRVFSQEFADECWDAKFGETYQDEFSGGASAVFCEIVAR